MLHKLVKGFWSRLPSVWIFSRAPELTYTRVFEHSNIPPFFLYMMHPPENYMYANTVNKKFRINVYIP